MLRCVDSAAHFKSFEACCLGSCGHVTPLKDLGEAIRIILADALLAVEEGLGGKAVAGRSLLCMRRAWNGWGAKLSLHLPMLVGLLVK